MGHRFSPDIGSVLDTAMSQLWPLDNLLTDPVLNVVYALGLLATGVCAKMRESTIPAVRLGEYYYQIELPGRFRGPSSLRSDETGLSKARGPMESNRAVRRREFWKHDTAKIGNLLLDALALDRQLSAQLFRRPNDDLLRRWQNCRRTLNRLIKDYTVAVSRYRILVKVSYRKRIRS